MPEPKPVAADQPIAASAIAPPVDFPAEPGLTTISDQPFRRQSIRPFQPAWAAAARLRAIMALPIQAGRALLVDAREGRAGARERIRQVHTGLAARTGRSLALYAHFAPHGGVSGMVLRQLRDYARLGFRVIFISASPQIASDTWAEICGIAEIALLRRNYGFDFGAWADALQVAWPAGEALEELLLVNDSVLGPLHALDGSFARLRAAGDGLFGMTESVQHRSHLQSYFLLARGVAATTDLADFLRGLRLTASKRLTVQRGEIGLTEHMRARGHQVAALWSYAELERAVAASESEMAALGAMLPRLARLPLPAGPGRSLALRRALLDLPLNPVHHFAGLLLRQFGFPFLKTELVLRNPARSPDALDWPALLPAGSVTAPQLIADHLLQQQQPLRRDRLAAALPPATISSGPTAALPAWRSRLDAVWAPRQAPAAPQLAAMPPAASLLDRAVRGELVLAFSHDDYEEHCGGVQNVISAEQRAFAAEGVGYLHLAPVVPREGLAEPAPDAAFLLRRDGIALGVARLPELLAMLGRLGARGAVTAGVVHQLSGHAPEHVLALLQAARVREPVVWVHDFGSLCESSPLLRNDVVFCGAPPVESAACTICAHGARRARHLARMRAFFAATRPQVLAPSAFALEFWQRHAGFPHAKAAVVPPARLVAAPNPLAARPSGRRLRIAHLGTRDFHKGWPAFEALARRFAQDPRYEFLQLGLPGAEPLPPSLRAVTVRVQSDRRQAMTEAVAAQRIDVAVNWSLCPETFCFTVHEALAGGAFVVARAGAGNVWPAIAANAPGRGIAVEDEAGLQALFEGDRPAALLAAAPPQRLLMLPGGGSAEWLQPRRAALPERASQHG